MRIYAVTCDGRAAAVVRAANPAEAIIIARRMAEATGLHGVFGTREPDDGEMVSWLERREDHLLPEAELLAQAS